MTKDEFIKECKLLGVGLNEKILSLFEKYKDLLIEWNDKFNLTSIVKEEEIYLKHFYDSLCLVKATDFNESKQLCDFGTGAGFPGMVIALLYENIYVTLIESNYKKCTFLEEVKKELNINNVTIINGRVEDYAKKNREIYDIVTCRAVSNIGIISELSISLLKIGGLFIPLKSNIKEELKRNAGSIESLGYTFIETIEYDLPIELSMRNIPIFKKNKKTDIKYPRNYNIILKSYK